MKSELKKYNRNVPDEDLIIDLKRVAMELGKETVTMVEYDETGKYSSGTIQVHFDGWNNALEAAGLAVKYIHYIDSSDLLRDLIKVAQKLKKITLTRKEYNKNGTYGATTLAARFGSWNKALEDAGLAVKYLQNIHNKSLFENIEQVWVKLGKQPGKRDMKQPLSKYSERPYVRSFGTWQKALDNFFAYINSDTGEPEPIIESQPGRNEGGEVFKHATKRNISDRLKVKVLMRDGNKCKVCGVTVTGNNIHFNHIKPLSEGGETVLENLQVLCTEHNKAKGDLEF